MLRIVPKENVAICSPFWGLLQTATECVLFIIFKSKFPVLFFTNEKTTCHKNSWQAGNLPYIHKQTECSLLQIFHNFRRRTNNHGIVRHIFRHNRSRTYNRIFSNGYAGKDANPGSNPRVLFDMYLFCHKRTDILGSRFTVRRATSAPSSPRLQSWQFPPTFGFLLR